MNRILRIIGILIGVIVILVLVGLGVVFAVSTSKLNQTWDDVAVVSIDTSSVTDEDLTEGERLFFSRGCIGCHGGNGIGTLFIDNPVFGTIPASNLTSGDGGIGQTYTTEDYVRAIQHGLRPDGTSLIIMPSESWQQMREQELVSLVAYLENLEPVDNVLPDRQIGLLGRVLVSLSPMSAELVDHETAGIVDVEYGATLEYGEYLAGNCASCHGANFAGGISTEPGTPPSANLTPHEDGIGNWTLDDFATVLRTGKTPDGAILSTDMPWVYYARMTDVEIEALYLYLQTVEPIAGN